MSQGAASRAVAIFAGGGALPPILAAAAAERGLRPVVFAIDGEADPASFADAPVHTIRWGEIGRMRRLAAEGGCHEAVFIGSIRRRPDFSAVRPDLGALVLLPRILRLLPGGDDALLSGVAALFEEHGIKLVGPLDVAPGLALEAGVITGSLPKGGMAQILKAAEAARAIGRLDIGQAAVAAGGRVVALEDAGGTDGLLRRVAELREAGSIGTGGVLVKCLKPRQDLRLDVPTIGPVTAAAAARAGLDGVAGEAGRTLLAGRGATIEAFRKESLFLLGLDPAEAG